MTVFHIKYRPQKLAELDLKDVGNYLKNILMSEQPPQSFLFCGPKGSGKTSAARIVAKAVNCLSPVDGDVCGKCSNCVEVSKGGVVDIVEMDAASNRGIEDVRVIKDRAVLLPIGLKKKVFIVDEAHMLTKEAFNALLKLIEEPPSHTFFILCTTDPGKLPETVLSRLTRVDFKKGAREELLSSLNRTIKGEKISIDDGVLGMFIDGSDGSFRNIQRDFNEMVMVLGKKLSRENVTEYLSKKNGEYLNEELESDMQSGNLQVIFDRWEKLATEGFDFGVYREKLVNYFQQKLVLGVGGMQDGLTVIELQRWLNLLINAGKQEKEAVVDQLPLELAIIEFFSSRPQNASSIQTTNSQTQTPNEKQNEVIVKLDSGEPEVADNVVGGGSIELGKLVEGWGGLLVAVKPANHSVEAFLRAVRPIRTEGKVVVFEVFYPFHKDKLEDPKNREIVEKGLKAVFGQDLGFRCVLAKDKSKPLEIRNDTPLVDISPELANRGNLHVSTSEDIYNVAKEIFG